MYNHGLSLEAQLSLSILYHAFIVYTPAMSPILFGFLGVLSSCKLRKTVTSMSSVAAILCCCHLKARHHTSQKGNVSPVTLNFLRLHFHLKSTQILKSLFSKTLQPNFYFKSHLKNKKQKQKPQNGYFGPGRISRNPPGSACMYFL